MYSIATLTCKFTTSYFKSEMTLRVHARFTYVFLKVYRKKLGKTDADRPSLMLTVTVSHCYRLAKFCKWSSDWFGSPRCLSASCLLELDCSLTWLDLIGLLRWPCRLAACHLSERLTSFSLKYKYTSIPDDTISLVINQSDDTITAWLFSNTVFQHFYQHFSNTVISHDHQSIWKRCRLSRGIVDAR